jgi:hypothetical protein
VVNLVENNEAAFGNEFSSLRLKIDLGGGWIEGMGDAPRPA